MLLRLRPIADQRAGIVARLEIKPIGHPLLLDELELAEDAGADRHEDHADLAALLLIGQAAPHDAAAVDERGRSDRVAQQRIEHVARIGAADMRAERAFAAIEILAIAETGE